GLDGADGGPRDTSSLGELLLGPARSLTVLADSIITGVRGWHDPAILCQDPSAVHLLADHAQLPQGARMALFSVRRGLLLAALIGALVAASSSSFARAADEPAPRAPAEARKKVGERITVQFEVKAAK